MSAPERGEQGIQGERGKTGDHGQIGDQGPPGPQGPRASTFITRNLVKLFVLISLGNILSFVAMAVGFQLQGEARDRDRQRQEIVREQERQQRDQDRLQQTAQLCLVAQENRADNNAQNDAMRNILKNAARTSGSDPARTEMLLKEVPANRPAVECNGGTVTTTVMPRP